MLATAMPAARRVWPSLPMSAALFAFLAASAEARPARGDSPSAPSAPSASSAPPVPSPANVAAARRHFDKARAFYEQGQYREAIGELDTAHALDPSAKDLVFNLGVVHEKLGDIEEALQWFRQYAGMNLTAQESDRAEAYVRRLEGARREVESSHEGPPRKAAPTTAPAAAPEPPAPPERPETQAPPSPPPPSSPPVAAPAPERRPSPSRFDAPVIATGVVAGVGLLTGVVLGIKAVVDRPGSDFVTGRDGTYGDFTSQIDSAHSEAVAADIAFGVAAVAGLACGYLYWLRPHSTGASGATNASISAGPLPGGGPCSCEARCEVLRQLGCARGALPRCAGAGAGVRSGRAERRARLPVRGGPRRVSGG